MTEAEAPGAEARPAERLAVPRGVLSAREMAAWQARATGIEEAERYAARLRDTASAAWRQARAEGYAQGHAEGAREGAFLLCRAAESLAATEEALREEVGAIAIAVLRRLVGDIDERRLVPALVRAALDARSGGAAGRLRVAPSWVPRLAGLDLGLPIEPDPDLAPGECLLDLAGGVREIGVAAQLAAIEAAFQGAVPRAAETAP